MVNINYVYLCVGNFDVLWVLIVSCVTAPQFHLCHSLFSSAIAIMGLFCNDKLKDL